MPSQPIVSRRDLHGTTRRRRVGLGYLAAGAAVLVGVLVWVIVGFSGPTMLPAPKSPDPAFNLSADSRAKVLTEMQSRKEAAPAGMADNTLTIPAIGVKTAFTLPKDGNLPADPKMAARGPSGVSLNSPVGGAVVYGLNGTEKEPGALAGIYKAKPGMLVWTKEGSGNPKPWIVVEGSHAATGSATVPMNGRTDPNELVVAVFGGGEKVADVAEVTWLSAIPLR